MNGLASSAGLSMGSSLRIGFEKFFFGYEWVTDTVFPQITNGN
jgi:hypothetical protein